MTARGAIFFKIMAYIAKKDKKHAFYFWYHSQDWINEGPVIEGLDQTADRTWYRPKQIKLKPIITKIRKAGVPKREFKARPRRIEPGDLHKSKVCRLCGELKLLHEYERNPRCTDGHVNTCRACRRKQENERKWKKITQSSPQ